ncbi:MAG: hypothetical protein PF495_12865 [Spirochaetales bacterium]|jgi:hypothetical protein|nr:hypothetical protein [Spirochaetales bacterium]
MKNKSQRWVSIFFAGCVLAGSFVFSGCVQVVDEPLYIPAVAASRGSNGVVTVSWPSRVGYRYRLFARKSGEKSELTESYGKTFMGTGENIEITFPLSLNQPIPLFSVMPEKIN